MNNIKTYIPILILVLIVAAGSFGVYKIQTYVSTFTVRVVEINSHLKTLESKKKSIELFKKILSKGSEEQEQIDMYILKGDGVFTAITNLEKDGKKTGILGENSGIVSVAKRENATLKEFDAGEVVVTIVAEGQDDRIDSYIEALDNLPFVSHLERVSIVHEKNSQKTQATIILVITELL